MKKITEIILEIRKEEPEAKIVVMGDFNDEPTDVSVQKMVLENQLYNPMQSLKDKFKYLSAKTVGIYLTKSSLLPIFLKKETGKLTFKYADVFDPNYIQLHQGKRKRTPYRTYSGKWHQGGFSDHFPVLAYLQRL